MSAIVVTGNVRNTTRHIMFRDMELNLQVVPQETLRLKLEHDRTGNHAFHAAWVGDSCEITNVCFVELCDKLGIELPEEIEKLLKEYSESLDRL